METAATGRRAIPALAWWQWTWLALAIASFLPTAYYAFQESQQVGRALRAQLIESCSLWETDPAYRGTPQAWTRFASFLLDTDQLFDRVRMKYGALAEQIELDFRRDAAVAYGKVVVSYLLAWGLPISLLYAAGWLSQRRRSRS